MSEIQRHCGVYVMSPNPGIQHFESLPREHYYNLERLRHQSIIYNNEPPKSVWFGTFHGIEEESAHVQEEVNNLYPFSRVEAWVAHELAARTNTRSYFLPPSGQNEGIHGDIVHESRNGLAGKLVDLNRQYHLNGSHPANWEEALRSIPYGPAKLPLQLVRDNPSLEVMISIHEDLDRGAGRGRFLWPPFGRGKDGIYLYDVRVSHDDPHDRAVESQFKVFGDMAAQHGFDLFSGRDDGGDSMLNNKVRNGLIRQSVYDRRGNIMLDTTFEMYLLYLKSLGLGSVKRAFVVEVPGKLERARKRELLTLLSDTFFYPILGQLGAL